MIRNNMNDIITAVTGAPPTSSSTTTDNNNNSNSNTNNDINNNNVNLHRIKRIKFGKRTSVPILLQNSNGPCPLLAVVNALLLLDKIHLPTHCTTHVSLEDVTNMLADYAMTIETQTEDTTFHWNELIQYLPKFQFGMDVNPKFISPSSYEYTAELTAYDMFHIPLYHGWLVEPTSITASILGNKSYNQVIDSIIAGKDAETELSQIQNQLDQLECETLIITQQGQIKRQQLQDKYNTLQQQAHDAHIMESFIHETSHQLTITGIEQLLQVLNDNEICIFFRNNHYNTMIKKNDHLFLLITDEGYIHATNTVWEKLDMINGDTELCNSDFNPVPQQHHSSNSTIDPDFQLALQLSQMQHQSTTNQANQQPTLVDIPPSNNNLTTTSTTTTTTTNQNNTNNTNLNALQQQYHNQNVEVGIPINNNNNKNNININNNIVIPPGISQQEAADILLAQQLQHEQQQPQHDDIRLAQQMQEEASLQLARQLQQQEDQLSQQQQQQQQQQRNNNTGNNNNNNNNNRTTATTSNRTTTSSSSKDKCIVM